MSNEFLEALFNCIFFNEPCGLLFISDDYASKYNIDKSDLNKIKRRLTENFIKQSNITQDEFKDKLFTLLRDKRFLDYSREIEKSKIETHTYVKKCFEDVSNAFNVSYSK